MAMAAFGSLIPPFHPHSSMFLSFATIFAIATGLTAGVQANRLPQCYNVNGGSGTLTFSGERNTRILYSDREAEYPYHTV